MSDLPVVHLKTIDSTSRYAAELLRRGNNEQKSAAPNNAPFIVWAEEQSGGRGRHGHEWQSPRGNLYVTIALPPPDLGAEHHGLLPLKAGVVLARFIEREFGLRITLKWPNDILFGGSKLGGILVETSLNGSRFGELLIGIGLNLNHAPNLKDGDYQAVALHSLLGHSLEVADVAHRFARGFMPLWNELPGERVVAAYSEYAVNPDEIFYHGLGSERRFARLDIMRDDGTQLLHALESTESVESGESVASGESAIALSHADHGWRWALQSAEPRELAIVDIGNTATKLAYFSDARNESAAWIDHVLHEPDETSLRQTLIKLRQHVDGVAVPLHITSVRPERTKLLMQLASALGWPVVVVKKRPVRRRGNGYALKDLGIDRLSAIEGWLASLNDGERRQGDHYGIVIAAGTATTVDAVTAGGRHLGGLILPGIKLALGSLHQAASLLPNIDPETELTTESLRLNLGRDTRSAMLSAVIQMTVGAVNEVRQRLQRQERMAELAGGIVVTGGWGQQLASRLGGSYKPELILSGARVLALGGWR